LPGGVSVGECNQLGLLLTFQLEIAVAHRVVLREMVAIIAGPNRPPAECVEWLGLRTTDHHSPHDEVWNKLFSPWAASARSAAGVVADQIASQRHARFLAEFAGSRQQESARSRHWLQVKADQLCGTFAAPTRDLFGEPESGPIWRRQQDSMTRLVSFATGPDVTVSKRREANDVLDTFRAMQAANTPPGPIMWRPIGMLMLVPRDAS
jgi:hypothetical protein